MAIDGLGSLVDYGQIYSRWKLLQIMGKFANERNPKGIRTSVDEVSDTSFL